MRTSEKRVAAEMERDLADGSAWVRLPEAPARPGPLATQVSVRLEPEDARRLRRVARALRIGYTSLLRQWIQQRLGAEEALLTSFSYGSGGYSVARTGTDVQVSSRDYTIRDLAIA